MSKYRIPRDDAPERRPVVPVGKPGDLPPHRIPVLDSRGNRRGHVGIKAGPSVAARMGVRNAVFKDGAWRGQDDAKARRRSALKRSADLRAAKGSVTKHPTKPETSARPKRGG